MTHEQITLLRRNAVQLVKKKGVSVRAPVPATGSSPPVNDFAFLNTNAGV